MPQNFSDDLLFDCGPGGIAELKNKINDIHRVYIAFCREQVNMEPVFLLINYIPPSVSGVQRGRYMYVGVLSFSCHLTCGCYNDSSRAGPLASCWGHLQGCHCSIYNCSIYLLRFESLIVLFHRNTTQR
jgi:hypothetical protein